MHVTPSGRYTEVRGHPLNASEPMDVTPSGISKEVSGQALNAPEPIDVMVESDRFKIGTIAQKVIGNRRHAFWQTKAFQSDAPGKSSASKSYHLV